MSEATERVNALFRRIDEEDIEGMLRTACRAAWGGCAE